MKNNLIVVFVVILLVSFSTVFASDGVNVETLSNNAVVEKIMAVPVPSVSITANPLNVQAGGSSIVSWTSINTTHCVASGGSSGWAGNRNIHGSFQTGGLYSNTTFVITCYGVEGNSVSEGVTVGVNSPRVVLEANPLTISAGGSSVLTWSSINATTCGASGGTNGWVGIKPLSGSFGTGSLYETTTYYISCGNGSGQWHNATVTITVTPKVEEPVIVKDRANKSLDFYGKLKVGTVVINLIRFPSGKTFILPSVRATTNNEWHINLWRGDVPFFFRLEGTPSMEIRIFDPSTARVTVLSSSMDF